MSEANTEAEAIAQMAIHNAEPFSADETGAVALPPGYRLADFEEFRERPFRTRRTVMVESLAELLKYGEQHAADNSRFYVSERKSKIGLIIDEPAREFSMWAQHRAVLELLHSESWIAWTGKDRKPLGQIEFAEFIEDHLEDIVEPEPVDLLQMVKDFQLKRDVAFTSVVHLTSGDVQFNYTENSSTSGSLLFPNKFSLGIAVYKNEQAFNFECRLKYRMREGDLQLRYEIVRIEKIVEAAFKKLEEQLASAGVRSFRGWPTA